MVTEKELRRSLKSMTAKIEKLFSIVQKYESDTFSASGHELTREEAIVIACRFVEDSLVGMIATTTIDGYMIAEELEKIRESAV